MEKNIPVIGNTEEEMITKIQLKEEHKLQKYFVDNLMNPMKYAEEK